MCWGVLFSWDNTSSGRPQLLGNSIYGPSLLLKRVFISGDYVVCDRELMSDFLTNVNEQFGLTVAALIFYNTSVV